jgi:hypothetical protein
MNILTILIFKCKIFTLPHNPIPGEKRSKEPLMKKKFLGILATLFFSFTAPNPAQAGRTITTIVCPADKTKDCTSESKTVEDDKPEEKKPEEKKPEEKKPEEKKPAPAK